MKSPLKKVVNKFDHHKKILFLVTLMIISLDLPAQVNKEQQINVEKDYAKLHTRQKRLAFTLAGGGLALIIISNNIRNSSIRNGTYYSNQFAPNTMMLAGGLSVSVSIPFFFAAAKNKGRALAKRSK